VHAGYLKLSTRRLVMRQLNLAKTLTFTADKDSMFVVPGTWADVRLILVSDSSPINTFWMCLVMDDRKPELHSILNYHTLHVVCTLQALTSCLHYLCLSWF